MRRAGLSSVREGCPEAVVRVGEPVDFVPPPHDAHFLLDGDPVLLPALDPDSHGWTVEQPERAARLREFGLHSLISVPMRARDTVLGLTTFMRSQNPVPFDEDDVAPARELVARAAVCVDNARRYTREHTAALVLQRSLLPHTLRGGTALDVASSYLPADAKDGVGGDWFDVIPLSGARVGLVIGDVVGHGIGAAATMGRLRTAVQTLADMDLPPDELLARLDDLVLRLSEEERAGGPAERGGTTVVGATCLYAVYDPSNGCCTMARAGHPPPVIVTPDDAVSFPDLPAGPPLGLGGLPFEALEIELPEGSLLGLYTDGLIEGADKDLERGMERLGRAVSRDGVPLEDLCPAVVKELLPVPQPDDIAFLLARTHRLSPEHLVSWDVPVDPAAVGEARAKVSRQLETWGLDELSMTTELIVSELVTNAIRYGEGPVRLRLLFQAALTCEVSDASNTSPRLRHARTTDEGGRGLFLVAQLAHRWGTRYTPRGRSSGRSSPFPDPALADARRSGAPVAVALGVGRRLLAGEEAGQRTPARISSSQVPSSTMRPPSRTTIRSALRTVAGRWAITRVVRVVESAASARDSSASPRWSRWAVVSSRTSTRGPLSSPRARATRARWPPDRVAPRSPTAVSRPSGRASAMGAMPQIRVTSPSSSAVASGAPRRRFSARVPWKSGASCPTTETAARRSSSVRSRRSTGWAGAGGTSSTAPASGSQYRARRCAQVDLPAPDAPTRATVSPGRTVRSRPSRTGSPP